jgi:hypothetical protein
MTWFSHALHPAGPLANPEQATNLALRRLACRHQHLTDEILAANV